MPSTQAPERPRKHSKLLTDWRFTQARSLEGSQKANLGALATIISAQRKGGKRRQSASPSLESGRRSEVRSAEIRESGGAFPRAVVSVMLSHGVVATVKRRRCRSFCRGRLAGRAASLLCSKHGHRRSVASRCSGGNLLPADAFGKLAIMRASKSCSGHEMMIMGKTNPRWAGL